MNDRLVSPTREKIFVVQPKETVIESDSFGAVTLRAMNVKRFREISTHLNNEHPEDFGYELLCEMARGPNGERFTVAAIAGLPAHALPDLRALVDQAVLLCGHRPADAKKA
ncbi:hypothetical protein HDG32_005519 [Paraburkholderia sp. CI2]|uniref:hypothetical protein n=1 Tax=Paraburkholderia sp. CI2 TaxID=2723093 RepID=UPI0016127FE3|nr:hypothetical protein [Paraburkholderia sp. CI2]MBB5469372.1 hypothetical protein [Paraburkholderia sp. CI2]